MSESVSKTFGWSIMGVTTLDVVNNVFKLFYDAGKLPKSLSEKVDNPIPASLSMTFSGAPTVNSNVGDLNNTINVVFPVKSGEFILLNEKYKLKGTATVEAQLSYFDFEVKGKGKKKHVYIDLTSPMSIDTGSFNLNPEVDVFLKTAFQTYLKSYFKKSGGELTFSIGSIDIDASSGSIGSKLIPTDGQFGNYQVVNQKKKKVSNFIAMATVEGESKGVMPTYQYSLLKTKHNSAIYFQGKTILEKIVVPQVASGLGIAETSFAYNQSPVQAYSNASFQKKGVHFEHIIIQIQDDNIQVILKGYKAVAVHYHFTATSNISASVKVVDGKQKIVFSHSKPDVDLHIPKLLHLAWIVGFIEGIITEIVVAIIKSKIKGKVQSKFGEELNNVLPTIQWTHAKEFKIAGISMPGDIVVYGDINP